MPDTALTTRVTEETFRRLKVQAAQTGRPMRQIVELALQSFLLVLEVKGNAQTIEEAVTKALADA